MSVARFRLLLVITTAINLWWISLPDKWDRLPMSTQEILRYTGRDALLPPEHWLASWNYYLYYSLLLAAGVGLFLFRRWGRTLLLIHTVFATVGALVAGVAVSPPLDIFVGSVAVTLTGVLLGILYFSPLADRLNAAPPQSAPNGEGRKMVRIALANVRFPDSVEESVRLTIQSIEGASVAGAEIVCFPECFVPGYRALGKPVAPPDADLLEEAWSAIAVAAAKARVAVVLGTERLVDNALVASAMVILADGSRAGFQDKVQIDPSEEGTYTPGANRQLFQAGALTFGVVICHEGWRYPETVRWAAVRGAHVVFHPHFHEAEPGSFRPKTFADPRNTFHEKAALCRAAENTCYFATVNYASDGSPTTSAIVNPDGTVHSFQPYGEEGLLIGEIDLDAATGLLAGRYQPLG